MNEVPDTVERPGVQRDRVDLSDSPLAEVLEHFVATRRSPNTRRNYRSAVRQFLEHSGFWGKSYPEFADCSFPEMHQHIIRFLADQEKRDTSEHLINPNTVNAKGNRLIAFFRFLCTIYQYPNNPAKAVPLPEKSLESQTPTLTKAELDRVMAYMKARRLDGKKAFRDYLIVLALFHFALRRHELAALSWEQMKSSPRWHFCVRQKRNQWKYLPIPPGYLKLLEEFAEKYGGNNPYIFHPTRNNKTKTLAKPLSTSAIYSIVKSVNTAALPNREFRPHSFRATFITLARKHQLDTKSIMNATGQATERMVNYYDLREKLEANAINFFGEWLE